MIYAELELFKDNTVPEVFDRLADRFGDSADRAYDEGGDCADEVTAMNRICSVLDRLAQYSESNKKNVVKPKP